MTDLPYRLVSEAGPAPMAIICDHASHRVLAISARPSSVRAAYCLEQVLSR